MSSSIIAALLLVSAYYFKEPMLAIAAGLFEIAGVIHSITRPRRLTIKREEAANDTN